LVTAVGAALLYAAPASAAATKIKQSGCPVMITQPGDYELATDIGPCAASTNGIVIRASNVSLQLKGHRIIGSTDPTSCNSGFGIKVGFLPDAVASVRIFGKGSVENFFAGLFAQNSADSFVKDLTVTGDCANLGFSYGFFFDSPGTNWKIEGNVVREPGLSSTGITLYGTDNNVVVRNDVNDSISLWDSSHNTVVNNVASDNTGGIFLLSLGVGPGSNDNQIHANTTTNNTNSAGLWIVMGSGNTITGNKAFGNTTLDLRDDNPACGTNHWHGNQFGIANQACIQ